MAQRCFIVLGDTTSHSGLVVTANSRMTIDGRPVACVGDKVTCPRCNGLHTILGCGKNTWLDNDEMACEKDPVSDGSYLISIHPSNATHDVDAGRVEVFKPAIAQAPPLAAPKGDFCLTCFVRASYRNARAEGDLPLGGAWRIRPDDALLEDLRAWLSAGAVEVAYPD